MPEENFEFLKLQNNYDKKTKYGYIKGSNKEKILKLSIQ